MGANSSYYPDLDYRVIFVSACSSFITLFVVNILNKWNFIKQNVNIKKKQTLTRKKVTLKKEMSKGTISTICDDMITPDFYNHTKIENFFETDNYLKLLPQDKNWPFRKIKLLMKNEQNYSEALHQAMLDHFNPTLIEKKSNPYITDIQRAITSFNEWRKWPITENSNDGWKYKTKTKDNMFVYTHSLTDSPLDIVKADKIIPYSVPIVVGILLNDSLMKELSPQIESFQILETTSASTDVRYLGVKCPPFIADRDFIDLSMIYVFKDGSILIGFTYVTDENKFNSKIKDNNKNYIRGTNNLSMYHVRPDYDGNIQHTRITFYNHILMNGFIPGMLLNANYIQLVKALYDLESNINKMRYKLHKPGSLWIFPNPYLKMMNIKITDEISDIEDMDTAPDMKIEEEKVVEDHAEKQETDFSGIWILKSNSESIDEYYKSEGWGFIKRKMASTVSMKQIIKQNGNQISFNVLVGPGGKFINETNHAVIGSGQETEYKDTDGVCRIVSQWNEDKTQILSDIYRVNDEKRTYKAVRALSEMTDTKMIITMTNNHGKKLVRNLEKLEETE